MKKSKTIKKLAILFTIAALVLSGCNNSTSNSGNPDNSGTSDPITQPETPDTPEQPDNPDTPEHPDNPDTPEQPDTDENITLDLTPYTYRINYISTKDALSTSIADWGAGSTAAKNDDGSWTLTANGSMWGGIDGVCAPFTGITPGTIANYDYIAFTADFSDFEINNAETGGNYGVNIKVPETQIAIPTYNKNKDGTYTYYIETSAFGAAPQNAVEFAIIIGGSGSLKLTEVFLAAKENPVKPVTSISILPESTSLASGASVIFTVKDSNFNDVTDITVFSIDGVDETKSTIVGNILLAGNNSGIVTVKATYTNDDGTFTATANVSVSASLNNLITQVTYNKAYLAPGWNPVLNNETDYTKASEYVNIDNNSVTYKLVSGLSDHWQAQLLLNTDANIKAGENWYFSCKLSGISGTYTLKINDDEILMPQQIHAFFDGEKINFSGNASLPLENIKLMFDFGTCSEGTVTISDIVFAVID